MRAPRFVRWVMWTIMSGIVCVPLAAFGQTTTGQAAAGGGTGTTAAEECPLTSVKTSVDTPIIATIDDQKGTVSGTVTKGDAGTVQICDSDGTQLGSAPVDPTTGAYKVTVKDLKATQKIQAQFINSQNQAGPASSESEVGTCSELAPKTGTAPTLVITTSGTNTASFSGTVPGATSGTIRICVNGVPNTTATGTLDSSGKYDGGTKTFTVNAGDKIVAQQVINATSGQYGPLSNEVAIVAQPAIPEDPNKAVSILIGGVEYAGYSAQSQTTNAFLNIYYRGPATKGWIFPKGISGWARIRLTGAPQQATNGVVSVVSDPTGLTTHDYSTVGQALDYVFGPSVGIAKNWWFVAGIGAITPFSSQNTPVTFVTPAAGTAECTELVSRFSATNGYNPALALNTAANATTCLKGGYTDIAFANQDRSSFLLKYGAGFRTSYPFKMGQCSSSSGSKCSTASAVLDATVGQDASVTGGQLHRFVFKLDGLLPIPTGSSSWLYLFGSSYLRLEANSNLPPLLLASPPSPVTVPSASVIVLPLRQPNRDYYRLGVGLNINQLWCKAFGSGCSTPTQSANGASGSNVSPTTPKVTTTKAGSAPKN